MSYQQVERIGDIYKETEFLAIRLPDGKAKTKQYVQAMACLNIAKDILRENGLEEEMLKRLDILTDIANSKLQEVKQ